MTETISKRLAATVYLPGYHSHNGFYNDGNSNYWADDFYIDLDMGKHIHHHNETWGGQNAGPSQHSHREENTWTIRDLKPLTEEDQYKLAKILEPLINTARKYPHRDSFQYFSKKHEYLIRGRIDKARKLATETDFYGIDNLQHVFFLPALTIAVKIYAPTAYNERHNWQCAIIDLVEPVDYSEMLTAIVEHWAWVLEPGITYYASEIAARIRKNTDDDGFDTRADLNWLDANPDEIAPELPLTQELEDAIHLTYPNGERP